MWVLYGEGGELENRGREGGERRKESAFPAEGRRARLLHFSVVWVSEWVGDVKSSVFKLK